jgi:hypothetical protein
MAAGLGFKTFTTGEVLTAADVNGYLMQGVLVFASEAARDAAITSPQEGQFAFTKDNNSLWYYSGAAWVASGATGDIEGVTAGTGISGGGTSGTVTITNSMATEIDAKGDLVVGTGADAFARLGVGANGTVLTAASGEATGLQWAAAAGGGAYTSIASGSLSSNAVNITSISGAYTDLYLVIKDLALNTDGEMSIRMNNDSNANRHYILGDYYPFGGSQTQVSSVSTSFKFNANNIDSPDADNQYTFRLNNYSVAQKHTGIIQSQYINTSSAQESYTVHCYYYQNDAITEVNLLTNQTFSGGTYILYGVK